MTTRTGPAAAVEMLTNREMSTLKGKPRITCHAAVTRDGESEPCEKPAVGWMRESRDEWGEVSDERPWPACAWHLNRWPSQVLTLDEIADALVDEA